MSIFRNGGEFGTHDQALFSSRVSTPYTPRISNESPIPSVGSRSVPANATKTNVLSSTTGNNKVFPTIDNKYTTYQSISHEVRLYEYYPITSKIMELIHDYIEKTIDMSADIISPSSGSSAAQSSFVRINEIFTDIDFRSKLKSNIDKLIYYGSESYAISGTKEGGKGNTKYRLSKLANPNNVVIAKYDDLNLYMVEKKAKEGGSSSAMSASLANSSNADNIELLTEDKILYIGSADFDLSHDQESKKLLDAKLKLAGDDFVVDKGNEVTQYNVDAYKKLLLEEKLKPEDKADTTKLNDDTNQDDGIKAFNLKNPVQKSIYKGIVDHKYDLIASKPLYYSVHQMLKDYLLKDIILYTLGVKSSVQPMVLAWGVDASYNYTVDELTNLVTTIESRMNKLVDIDLIQSSSTDMDQLVNRILGNIRVIPDLGNNIRALDEKEVDNIGRRIEDLINRRTITKDEILDALGIPKDLFEGATNREEVIKRDDRFQSMILKILGKFRKSVINAALTFARLEGITDLKESDIAVTFLKKSSIEYNINTQKLDSIRDYTNTIATIVSDIQQITSFQCIDKAKLGEHITAQLKLAGEDLADLIDFSKLVQADPENGGGY